MTTNHCGACPARPWARPQTEHDEVEYSDADEEEATQNRLVRNRDHGNSRRRSRSPEQASADRSQYRARSPPRPAAASLNDEILELKKQVRELETARKQDKQDNLELKNEQKLAKREADLERELQEKKIKAGLEVLEARQDAERAKQEARLAKEHALDLADVHR